MLALADQPPLMLRPAPPAPPSAAMLPRLVAVRLTLVRPVPFEPADALVLSISSLSSNPLPGLVLLSMPALPVQLELAGGLVPSVFFLLSTRLPGSALLSKPAL